MVPWSLISLRHNTFSFFPIIFSHRPQSSLSFPGQLSFPVCRRPFSIMLHIQANCAAKGIISEHWRLPVYLPPPQPPHHPGCVFPSSHLQCAFRAESFSQLSSSTGLLSGPHGLIEPGTFYDCIISTSSRQHMQTSVHVISMNG